MTERREPSGPPCGTYEEIMRYWYERCMAAETALETATSAAESRARVPSQPECEHAPQTRRPL